MKLRDWSAITRCFLVGMLVFGMAVQQAAARRLFQRRCCRKTCTEVCPPVCLAPSHNADCPCPDDSVSSDSEWAPAVSETTQAGIAFEIAEELAAPTLAPAEVSDSPLAMPEPLAVPDSDSLATPDPAPVEPPTAAVTDDRYSGGDPIFDRPKTEDSSAPSPLDELPPSSADTGTTATNALFDEPAEPMEEDYSPETETPLPESTPAVPPTESPAPKPKQDFDALFGPTDSPDAVESDVTEEEEEESGSPPNEQNPNEQSTEQPASDEPAPEPKSETEEADDYFDPFGKEQPAFGKQTVVLASAGGLQSAANRIWTDSTSTHRCEARLMRVTAKNVVLLRSTGAKLVVPHSRLGDADLQFVYQQITALRIVRTRDSAAAKLAVTWAK